MSAALIDEALTLIQDRYIFPDKAATAAGLIRARRLAGDYAGLDEATLGERLTAVLLEVTNDKHLRIRTRDPAVREAMTEEQMVAAYRERLASVNYGIVRVERLDGNVGLLEMNEIPEAGTGGHAVAAAMGLLAHTTGLILDLRGCRGGTPNGGNFLTSYFFADDETHLLDIYDGASGKTRQYWSLAYLPGPRYTGKPVYVLTSGSTFSGGEEICYVLQAHGRATVVGETTRGGAHPTAFLPLSPTMEVTVPVARAISPVTGTNWEGTGVVPDVAVPAADALSWAYTASAR
ncbi:S41 family peptidase [Actinoplanes sp. NPDC051494]|uniref:S41 family peptidase n=1 Tax=Actinoplanes sp. NPDC051494 TaxID=3363907 RepID=UPI00379E21F9